VPLRASTAVRRLAPYLAIAVAVTVLLCVLRIPISRLDVPYTFAGDAIDKVAQIANVAQTGWLFHNDRLGFPFGYDRLDFPRFDSLNYALLGPVATLIGPGAAMNLYYIAGFYLIAFAAYWSLRRFGFSLAPSVICALLYAFLPYRLIRGVGHLTNGAYFLVPLGIVALTWLALGRLDTRTPEGRRRFVFAIVIAALIPLQMPYNGVFVAYLAGVAAAVAIARDMRWRHVAIAAALLAATCAAFVAEQVPVMLHASEAGKPPFAAERSPGHAELYAMRLNQVLMPTAVDRRPAVAAATRAFDEAMGVPDAESRNQYIGALGILGFIALMWSLCRAIGARAPPVAATGIVDAESATRVAALFAIAIVLLAISSGFGTLIAFWITAKIRTYNRALPFLAFACLVGGAWMLETTASRIRVAWLRHALLAIVALLALYDLLLKPPYPHHAAAAARYDRASAFFKGVEQRLGDNAAVFQLPVSWYPEHLPIRAMGDYEEFVPYLLTRTLRVSYGVGRGRPGYKWNKYVESLPAKDAIAAAHARGFAAILIDGDAYDRDALKAMTDAFAGALPGAPSVSEDRRWWLFPLDGCCAGATPTTATAAATAYDPVTALFVYSIGSGPIRFATGGEGLFMTASAWEDPETWGAWSEGTHASLRMRLDPVPAGPLDLTLDTHVVVGPNVPERKMALAANGRRIADVTYGLETSAQTLHVELPAGAIGKDGVLALDFETMPAASPQTAGLSEDGRNLGVGLTSLSITPKGAAR
jgi:phosphoglycerol transferase